MDQTLARDGADTPCRARAQRHGGGDHDGMEAGPAGVEHADERRRDQEKERDREQDSGDRPLGSEDQELPPPGEREERLRLVAHQVPDRDHDDVGGEHHGEKLLRATHDALPDPRVVDRLPAQRRHHEPTQHREPGRRPSAWEPPASERTRGRNPGERHGVGGCHENEEEAAGHVDVGDPLGLGFCQTKGRGPRSSTRGRRRSPGARVRTRDVPRSPRGTGLRSRLCHRRADDRCHVAISSRSNGLHQLRVYGRCIAKRYISRGIGF